MPNPRTLGTGGKFTPKSIKGLSLWLDGADPAGLYTTDAGAVTAVSSPTEISGCVGWWDASDASSITASGGLVSQINDKSGLAAHASQATSGSRPTLVGNALNGRSVLRFDGGDALTGNFASALATGAYSVFAVCKDAALVTNGRVFSVAAAASADFDSGSVIPCCTNASSPGQLSAFDGASGTNRGAVSGFSSYAVFSGVVGSSSVVNASNGAKAASASATFSSSITRFGIGAPAQGGAGGWNGDIAEVIYYSSALSATDRARVEAYLAQRWGISGVHTPATAANDPVGYWGDRSGNGRHVTQSTAANRPTISATTQNGRKTVTFSGAPKTMSRTGYTFENGLSGLTRYAVCSMGIAGPTFLTRVFSGGGDALLQTVNSQMRFFAGSSAYVATDSPNYAAIVGTSPRILGSVYDGAAANLVSGLRPYLDGTSLPPNATSGTLPATLPGGTPDFWLGSNIGANNYWNGVILEYLSYSRALTTAERRRLERYLAAKWGITLAPQVSNADAQDWINRVYAQGGAVTAGTAAAVSAFCDSINAASMRSRFYRLNLFCGSSLTSALVPLYRNYRLSAGRNEIQGEVFSGWTTSAATVTGNAAQAPYAAPSGAPLASSLKEAAGTTAHTLSVSYTASGGACVVSAYVKADGRDWALFSVEDAGGNAFAYAYFNIAGVATGSAFSGATDPTITNVGNNWTRVSFRCTPTAGTRFVRIFTSGGNNNNVTAGDTTKGLLIWGVQLEYGTLLSDYDSRPLGGATDINVGPFVSEDYAESTGLTAGLSSTKYLDTGLSTSALPVSVYESAHLSAWHGAIPAIVTDPFLLGANNGSTDRFNLQSSIRTTAAVAESARLGKTTTATGGTLIQGARPATSLIGSRTSATSLVLYRNGVADATQTTSTTGIGSNAFSFYVFRINNTGSVLGDMPGFSMFSYSIGDDLTAAQAASLHSALAAFHASMGRSV